AWVRSAITRAVQKPTSDCFSRKYFFFSSRRRHTRCYRDWSSDVCSSDLQWPRVRRRRLGPQAAHQEAIAPSDDDRAKKNDNTKRSEERRVGKEYRTGMSREKSKKRERERSER